MEEMIAERNQEVDQDPFASDVAEEETEENKACVDSNDSGTTGTSDDEQ